MLFDLLNKLIPVNDSEIQEWKDLLSEFRTEHLSSEKSVFWYLSSGFDTKLLSYFSEKDTLEVYNTPIVDLFIFSDYWRNDDDLSPTKKIRTFYNQLDYGEVCLYKDVGNTKGRHCFFPNMIMDHLDRGSTVDRVNYRTYVTIDQIIPLRLFSESELAILRWNYPKKGWGDSIVDDGTVYFCMVNIWSKYFGEEYFPILFFPMDNWLLLDILIKHQTEITYIAAVRDGCRRGGAYKCANQHFEDFLPVMSKRRYWITGHFYDNEPEQFKRIARLPGLGDYGDAYGSYLYEIDTP